MFGGVIEILFGIDAEGKSLESITKPMTSVETAETVEPEPTTA